MSMSRINSSSSVGGSNCTKCDLSCGEESLACAKCQNIFHYKCTKLPKRKILKLLKDEKPFYCTSCYYPCPVCKKTTQNTTCMKCPLCDNWYHINCTKMTKKQSRRVFRSNAHYYCFKCINEILPFSNQKNIDPDSVPPSQTTLSSEIVKKCSDNDEVDKNCEFLSPNDLAGVMNENEGLSNEGLSIFHANIRSLPKNISNLKHLFNGCAKLPDIIAITESKVNSNTNEKLLQIDGYKKPLKDNSKTSAGGVYVYVSNSISSKIREDLKMDIDNCENVWLEVNYKNTKSKTKSEGVIVGLIYRHPVYDFSDFKNEFSKQLLKISKQNYIIAGDFNINLLEAPTSHNIADYVHSVASTGCNFHINKYTRISKTLLDHVYSNYNPKNVDNKIVLSELSPNDHFSTLSNFHQCKVDRVKPKEIFVRKKFLSCEELQSFNNELYVMLNGSEYQSMTDVDKKATYVTDCYVKLIDKYMPLRKLSKMERRFYNTPWINKDLQKDIEKREVLHKIKLKDGTEESKEIHRKFKNRLSKKLFSAKRKFMHNKIYGSIDDKGKMWKAINQIGNGYNFNNCNSNSIRELVDNEGNIVNDPKQKANLLNDYFNKIGNDLDKLLPKGKDPMSHVHDEVLNSMFLSFTDNEEMYNLINKLRKKSPGPDGITGYLLKMTQDVIIPILTDLFNKCMKNGVFPDVFKKS